MKISFFETRTRIFSFNLVLRDENENFFFQSRVSRREREIENHFSWSSEKKSSWFSREFPGSRIPAMLWYIRFNNSRNCQEQTTPLYCSIEVYNSTVFAFLARGESWTAVQHSDWLLQHNRCRGRRPLLTYFQVRGQVKGACQFHRFRFHRGNITLVITRESPTTVPTVSWGSQLATKATGHSSITSQRAGISVLHSLFINFGIFELINYWSIVTPCEALSSHLI